MDKFLHILWLFIAVLSLANVFLNLILAINERFYKNFVNLETVIFLFIAALILL